MDTAARDAMYYLINSNGGCIRALMPRRNE
jgi:hypothetical protein